MYEPLQQFNSSYMDTSMSGEVEEDEVSYLHERFIIKSVSLV